MFLLANTREHVLPHMPKGGNIVEVGVNMADFSRPILDNCAPQKLHLVDPWEMSHADDDYADTTGVEANRDKAEDRYEHVLNTVGPEIEKGIVQIHRAYSDDVIDQFPDNSLDWVYIDANHQYEYVKKDLEMFYPKLKEDGLMLGHDYANNEMAQRYNFGVIEAVNEICAEKNMEFLALTCEAFPTFYLAKNAQTPRVQSFVANILYHLTPVIQIHNFTAKKYQQVIIDFGENRLRPIITID